MQEEIWRPIKGFEGYYEVSNLGRVYSVPRVVEYFHFRARRFVQQQLLGKVLKTSLGANGYRVVSLSKNGKNRVCHVSRLVAEAFIDNPDNKPFVDHINTIRTDDRVDNLRWVDSQENSNNILTHQKSFKRGFSLQFGMGMNANSAAMRNKEVGVCVDSYSVKIKSESLICDGNLIIFEDEIRINLNEYFFLEKIKNFKSFEVEF